MDNYLERELRSDHAGETGAVYIYKGIAAVAKISNDAELLSLAKHHGATEEAHLQLIESVLANNLRSRLLALWRIAGWLIGAVPAMFGRRAVYATVMAVETFVENQRLDWQQIFFPGRAQRGWNSPIASYYGVNMLPTIWLLDPNGIVAETNLDASNLEAKLREVYTPFLKKK